jgi:hypothetical protein
MEASGSSNGHIARLEADGGHSAIMAKPFCRKGPRRIVERLMRTGSRCLRAAAVMAVAASLAGEAQAQILTEPMVPSQGPTRPQERSVPTYPLVKPGLPPPEHRIGQPAQPPSAAFPAPITVRVRQSKTHPNGMTISVDTVSFLPSSIVISIEVFNPAADRRRINPFGSLQLTDERGGTYLFLPPPDNPELQIAPQSHVLGRLVFLGAVDWQARTLRLTINHPLGSPTDRMTTTPLFQFILPAEPRS